MRFVLRVDIKTKRIFDFYEVLRGEQQKLDVILSLYINIYIMYLTNRNVLK